MRMIVMGILVVVVGCGGGVTTHKRAPLGAHASPLGCDWQCGDNGTRMHGTVDDTAPRIESITLPAGTEP